MVKQNDCMELIVKARLGNRDSLNALAARVHDRLYPYLYRVTCDHHASQDLLQEVLLTMLRCVSSLEKPESFWPWIYRVARSRVHRHRKFERRRQMLHAQLFDDAYHTSPRHSNSSVLELLARQETRRSVSVALRRLDRRYRDVVRLRCFERMSYSQIACRTQSSPEVARIRFLRAKNSLKSSPVVAAVAGD
jgi:RNA polymerase sigma factor (sigma-70 family)